MDRVRDGAGLRAGTGHSFNTIADTDGDLNSVADLPPVMELDAAAGLVHVAATVCYGDLAQYLDARGFALANLGSLPHISVGRLRHRHPRLG